MTAASRSADGQVFVDVTGIMVTAASATAPAAVSAVAIAAIS